MLVHICDGCQGCKKILALLVTVLVLHQLGPSLAVEGMHRNAISDSFYQAMHLPCQRQGDGSGRILAPRLPFHLQLFLEVRPL